MSYTTSIPLYTIMPPSSEGEAMGIETTVNDWLHTIGIKVNFAASLVQNMHDERHDQTVTTESLDILVTELGDARNEALNILNALGEWE